MIGAVLALICFGGLVALAKAGSEGTLVTIKNPHVDLSKFVADSLGTADVEEIEAAAHNAEVSGSGATAEVLREKAALLRQLPAPPFPEPNALGWRKFVRCSAYDPPTAVTPDGRYGSFGFTVRRLADMGLVRNLRPISYQGRRIWGGDFVPPLSSKLFLGSWDLQYKTFVRSCADYRLHWKRLRASEPELFVSAIDGKPLTLSGWLGLCHRSGLPAAIKWLRNRGERFPKTTAAVRRCNGIF